jgi:putative addiction module killer protein
MTSTCWSLRTGIQRNLRHRGPIGEGLSELRIDFGPGYRVYYARAGKTLYLLLCGGDKSSQDADIKNAHAMWKELNLPAARPAK